MQPREVTLPPGQQVETGWELVDRKQRGRGATVFFRDAAGRSWMRGQMGELTELPRKPK